MKRIIGRKEYDTENAGVVRKVTFGRFGDPEGYEESLFRTPDGSYFLYTNGGERSLYPTENIQRLSAPKAEEWLSDHRDS